jgi:hypothetical protein
MTLPQRPDSTPPSEIAPGLLGPHLRTGQPRQREKVKRRIRKVFLPDGREAVEIEEVIDVSYHTQAQPPPIAHSGSGPGCVVMLCTAIVALLVVAFAYDAFARPDAHPASIVVWWIIFFFLWSVLVGLATAGD